MRRRPRVRIHVVGQRADRVFICIVPTLLWRLESCRGVWLTRNKVYSNEKRLLFLLSIRMGQPGHPALKRMLASRSRDTMIRPIRSPLLFSRHGSQSKLAKDSQRVSCRLYDATIRFSTQRNEKDEPHGAMGMMKLRASSEASQSNCLLLRPRPQTACRPQQQLLYDTSSLTATSVPPRYASTWSKQTYDPACVRTLTCPAASDRCIRR